MLKKGGIIWTIWNVLVAALFVTFGIVTCANSGNPDFQSVIILIAGIIVIVDAAVRLLTQVIGVVRIGEVALLKTNWGTAVAASSELAVGILLILVSTGDSAYLTAILEYMTKFIGILLITAGSIAVIYSIVYLARKAFGVPQNIGVLILGLLAITAGILVLVYATNSAMLQVFFILFGVLFVIAGLSLLIGAIIIAVVAAKAKKAVDHMAWKVEEAHEVLEGEAEEKPEEKPSEDKPE